MRLLFIYLICFVISTAVHAQKSKAELQEYLSNFEEDQLISENSWLIGMGGDTLRLSQFAGKWVLIDYWSVTCRPCLKELPALNKYANTHASAALEVIAVSVDPDQLKWQKNGPKRVGSLPSYYAGRSVDNDLFGLNLSLMEEGGKYNLYTTLPRYSLIDPTGRIVKKDLDVKPSSPEFPNYISSLIK